MEKNCNCAGDPWLASTGKMTYFFPASHLCVLIIPQEQIYADHKNRTEPVQGHRRSTRLYHQRHPRYAGPIGLPTNVWAIGAVMYYLIMKKPVQREYPSYTYKGRPLRSAGYRLLQPGLLPRGQYSDELLELVLRCLAWEPRERPDAEELLEEIEEVRRTIRGGGNQRVQTSRVVNLDTLRDRYSRDVQKLPPSPNTNFASGDYDPLDSDELPSRDSEFLVQSGQSGVCESCCCLQIT